MDGAELNGKRVKLIDVSFRLDFCLVVLNSFIQVNVIVNDVLE